MVGKYRRLCDEWGAMKMLNYGVSFKWGDQPLSECEQRVEVASFSTYHANSAVWLYLSQPKHRRCDSL